ncbi:MAG: bacteriocin [Chryseobacterium sp.]|jgi:hypothetical protein|uniref:hypothetical protein n=1 Tax=Chryseobacterium sp. TaxID=1871047 RepID=UPI002617AD56|nr:hypothetical protein [Chryseobacterium sp.]MDF2553383.1 bacteriocin [Chryseobacterium sp.]MDF2934472.1 bacteriocin [Chryseobacterium sp.]
MKKLTRKNLMKINGGNIRFPDENGNCQPGWYLCPSNICVYDNGGQNPIVPGSLHYNACFG